MFTQHDLYNYETSVCSEFFDLSCRSTPKKFVSICCYAFHRFCHVLSLLTFANLKLAFSLQKLFGNLYNKIIFSLLKINIFLKSYCFSRLPKSFCKEKASLRFAKVRRDKTWQNLLKTEQQVVKNLFGVLLQLKSKNSEHTKVL